MSSWSIGSLVLLYVTGNSIDFVGACRSAKSLDGDTSKPSTAVESSVLSPVNVLTVMTVLLISASASVNNWRTSSPMKVPRCPEPGQCSHSQPVSTDPGGQLSLPCRKEFTSRK